jgi:hypothetical protein
MTPATIRIAESVEIAAPPGVVFELVSDSAAKLRLNPFVEVIRVEREGPPGEGVVTFLRFQRGHRFIEYRTRCVAWVPDRLLESEALLPTAFRVRVEVEPCGPGTRLTQREECEVTADMLEHLLATNREERGWRAMKLLHYALPMVAREAFAIILQERVDRARKTMALELHTWLLAIKRHLEAPAGAAS